MIGLDYCASEGRKEVIYLLLPLFIVNIYVDVSVIDIQYYDTSTVRLS